MCPPTGHDTLPQPSRRLFEELDAGDHRAGDRRAGGQDDIGGQGRQLERRIGDGGVSSEFARSPSSERRGQPRLGRVGPGPIYIDSPPPDCWAPTRRDHGRAAANGCAAATQLRASSVRAWPTPRFGSSSADFAETAREVAGGALEASDGLVVDEVDDEFDGVGVGFGEDAVAEVEDVAAVTAAMENVFDASREEVSRSIE
jgi:hypothetical protein